MSKSGFTLIEAIITVTLLALMAIAANHFYMDRNSELVIRKAQYQGIYKTLKRFAACYDEYYAEHGDYGPDVIPYSDDLKLLRDNGLCGLPKDFPDGQSYYKWINLPTQEMTGAKEYLSLIRVWHGPAFNGEDWWHISVKVNGSYSPGTCRQYNYYFAPNGGCDDPSAMTCCSKGCSTCPNMIRYKLRKYE